MKAMFRLIVTLLLLIGWGLAAGALHVVWTGNAVVLVPKQRFGGTDTYVDASKWTKDDVSNHPVVVKRLVATDNADSLAHIFKAKNEDDLIDEISGCLKRGPMKPKTDLLAKAQDTARKAKNAVRH